MIIDNNRKPTPPGEWEIDTASGRRYRFDGRVCEYEPTILTSNGTLTEQQLHQMNAAKKNQTFTPAVPEPSKNCPFKSGMQPKCDGEACAWYTATGCAQVCPHPAAGKKCPYKHAACAYDCALRPE